MDIEITLEERVNGLHADVHLEGVQVSVILEGHGGEANSVVVANSLVKEQTFDSKRDAVKRHFGRGWSDHIQLPELVNKVHASVSA